MFRKLMCSMVVMVVAVGFAFADELQGVITQADAAKSQITFQKMKKKDKDGDPIVLTVAKDATIAKGKFADKKLTAGDKIEDGLKNEIFTKIGDKGLRATVTVDGDKCSQILVIAGKKKAAN